MIETPPLIPVGLTEEVVARVHVMPDQRVEFVPNAGIVVGDRSVLVIDTAMGPRNGERILAEARRLGGERRLLLTTTHFHPEHAFGSQSFSDATYVCNAAQAEEMAKLVGSGASVGTIDFAIKVPSIVFSIDQDVAWAKKFGLKIAGNASNPSDDIAGGEKAMTSLLGKYPSIKGVMAYNDPSAIGAYSAARSQGITGLALAGENGGSDALGAIKAGRETFTIKLDDPSMGKSFAWGLYDLSEGVKIPTTIKAGPPVLVNKDNVDSIVPWETQLKQEYPGS